MSEKEIILRLPMPSVTTWEILEEALAAARAAYEDVIDRTLTCRNENCRKPFVRERHDQFYCCRRCAYAQQQRDHRKRRS